MWERGLPTTGNKNELVLVALAFGASLFSIKQKASTKDAITEKAQQYRKLLSTGIGYMSHTAVLLTNSTALSLCLRNNAGCIHDPASLDRFCNQLVAAL